MTAVSPDAPNMRIHPSKAASQTMREFDQNLRWTSLLCLGVILGTGAWLRFYNLDTPSMWADEMQAAFGASFPLDYLFRWIMAIEVHPPTYHLLLKAFLLGGDADMVLRLPSAIFGTASIYLLYRLAAENYDEETGLFSAALLAGDSLHIWISRQVRPYGVLVFLFCLSLLYLCRFLREGTEKDFRRFLLANAPLVLFHLLSVLILAAQAVILSCAVLVKRVRLKHLLWFLAASTAVFTLVSPVFIKTLLSRPDLTVQSQMDKVVQDSLTNLAGLFDFFKSGWMFWVYFIPLCAGLLHMGLYSRGSLVIVAGFVLVPMSIIIMKQYASYYFSTHLAFMLPVLLVPAGLGLKVLTRTKAAAAGLMSVCLVLGLGYAVFTKQSAKLYDEDSLVVTWWNFGTFKTMGRQFSERFTEKDLVLVQDPFVAASIDWYYHRLAKDNVLRSQHLGPDDERAHLFVLNLTDEYGELSGFISRAKREGALVGSSRIDSLRVQELSMPRTPVTKVRSLPAAITFTAEPDDIYAHAYALRDVAIYSSGGCSMHATGYDSQGAVEYVLENQSGRSVGFVALGLGFENTGEGNSINLEYSFDDAQPVRTTVTRGPDSRRFFYAEVEAPPSFSRLHVKVGLVCSQITPRMVSGSLQTLLLRNVFVALCGAKNDGPCSEAVTDWYKRMQHSAYLREGFLKSGPSQSFSVEEASLAQWTTEKPGWEILSPTSQDLPVYVRVECAAVAKDVVFYPRVGSKGDVRAYKLAPDGTRVEIFLLPGGKQAWSPMGAQYPIALGQGPILLELRGKEAQLWLSNGKVLFQP